MRPLLFETDPGYDGEDTYTPKKPPAPTPTPIAPIPIPPSNPAPSVVEPDFAFAVAPSPVPRRADTALPVPVVVGTARYAAEDYAAAARALMPRGRVWPDDPESAQGKVLGAIAATLERSDAAASALLAGVLPGTLTPLLPEWEATLGLPDPCAGENPTIEQRLDQVRGRFVGVGGQSRARYLTFAAALGFEIEIVNFAPWRAGLTPVGNACASDAWSFVWGVRIVSTAGTLPISVLMCELETIKPAETIVLLLI